MIKNKGTKCIINQSKNQIILQSQQRFKKEAHNVFTEQINRITLSFNGKGNGHPSDLDTRIKIITAKEMHQILSIALAQVKAGN